MSYLHDTICLMRVLVFCDVFLQRWERHLGAAVRPCTSRISAQKFVQDLAQQLMCDHSRVLLIRNYDARYAFGARVCVEGVRLLLDVLSLASPCAFGHGLREEGHELADAATREAGV
jgi:hypothetical protein